MQSIQKNIKNNMDYFSKIVDDEYTNITCDEFKWPKNFTKRMKRKFLRKMVTNMTNREKYEECAKLNNVLCDVENE